MFLLVVRSFLRKITTMTKTVAVAHKRSKEPGGTIPAMNPILTALTLMDHTLLLLPMASNGKRSEVTTIP